MPTISKLCMRLCGVYFHFVQFALIGARDRHGARWVVRFQPNRLGKKALFDRLLRGAEFSYREGDDMKGEGGGI